MTLSISTRFNLLCFGSVDEFLYREMVLFGGSFWVYFATLFVALLGFINSMFFRFRDQKNISGTVDSNCGTVGTKSNVNEFVGNEDSVPDEEEAPHFFSGFQFKSYEEFIGSNVGHGESDIAPVTNTSKYEFISGKAFGVLVEEPEALSFTVKELYAGSNHVEDMEEQKKEDVKEESPEICGEEDESESAEFLSEKDLLFSDSVVSRLEDVISIDEDKDGDITEELQKLEESEDDTKGSDKDDALDSNMLSQVDFHVDNSSKGAHELNVKDNDTSDDLEDSNGFESVWEHQELIEQLKMELKKVKATGLPTIPEESEYPKMMEDLKPWKIEEKMEQQDTMGKLYKFYETYRERMRKFDILNYQKMYAIGFLQSKDHLQSLSITKSSIPVIGSLLNESFKLCKRKKWKSDPMVKFMRELHSDLEMVYVGQLCLSWEFLHWQYEKTLELWESDPRGIRRYNEVAGEFQQFQVLIQRFIENEPFEGPRAQNYVKNRCILRNLLQVPVIREDTKMDQRKVYAVTSHMLVEIMEESIRIFWQFVRADKDTQNVMHIIRREIQTEVQDPADKKLLFEVREDHQKKERKLKEILRGGNCILRRFLRHEEESSEQVLYFFSQVDMKLVGRVLNMSRVTSEQLLWCHNKLSKISLVNRKISVEPSFLLFPC